MASSTSNTQFGGIHVTGGGKRSTPRTVAKWVSLVVFVAVAIVDSPLGNMSATSLLLLAFVSYWDCQRHVHSPVTASSAEIQNVLCVFANRGTEERVVSVGIHDHGEQMARKHQQKILR